MMTKGKGLPYGATGVGCEAAVVVDSIEPRPIQR